MPESKEAFSIDDADDGSHDAGSQIRRLSITSIGSFEENERVVRSCSAFLHLINGNVGSGVLQLPLRFALVGLPVGLVCMGVVIVHYFVGLWLLLLVQTRLDEEQPRIDRKPRSFDEVGFAVLGLPGRYLVQFAVSAVQFGVCIIYVSFISVSICAFLPSWNYYLVLILVVSCCACLSLLPDLEVMAPFSLFGTVVMSVAMVSVVGVSFGEMLHPTSLSKDSPATSHDAIMSHHTETPLSFFASAFYSFEGVALVLPIKNSLRLESVAKFPKVLYSAMIIVAIIFTLLGSTGATTFTNIDSASVTAFLTRRYEDGSGMDIYFHTLNVFVAVSVLLTYPLQLMPASEIVISRLGIRRRRLKALLRLACTCICALVVLVLPKLGALIKLNGSAFSTTLGALPFIFHGSYTWSNRKQYSTSWVPLVVLDSLAVLLCCVVMVVGVKSTIEEITTPVNSTTITE